MPFNRKEKFLELKEGFFKNIKLDKINIFGFKNSFICLKRKFKFFEYDNNKYEFPIGIKICAKERALIYINDELIGKFEENSPQNIFYISQYILKQINEIEVFLDADRKDASFGYVFPQIELIDFVVIDKFTKFKIDVKDLEVINI